MRTSIMSRIRTIKNMPEPANEREVEIKVVYPLITDLGWDPVSQIEWERRIGPKPYMFVDMALSKKRSNRPIALVEAKAVGQDLEHHLNQLLTYAFHETANMVIITNGYEWWFYLPREEGSIDDRRFASISIKDDHLDTIVDTFIKFLSEDNVISGRAFSQGKHVLKSLLEYNTVIDSMPDIWEKIIDEPAPELIKLVADKVKKSTGIMPTDKLVISTIKGEAITEKMAVGEPNRRVIAAKPSKLVWYGTDHLIYSYKNMVETVLDIVSMNSPEALNPGRWKRVARTFTDMTKSHYVKVPQLGFAFSLGGKNAEALRAMCRKIIETFGYDIEQVFLVFDDGIEKI